MKSSSIHDGCWVPPGELLERIAALEIAVERAGDKAAGRPGRPRLSRGAADQAAGAPALNPLARFRESEPPGEPRSNQARPEPRLPRFASPFSQRRVGAELKGTLEAARTAAELLRMSEGAGRLRVPLRRVRAEEGEINMTLVTIPEAQARLPELLSAVAAGESESIRAEDGRVFQRVQSHPCQGLCGFSGLFLPEPS